MAPSHWDNKVFAFNGDIVNGQLATVEWDETLYAAVSNNAVVVGTNELVSETLATDVNIGMMGPFSDGDRFLTNLPRDLHHGCICIHFNRPSGYHI